MCPKAFFICVKEQYSVNLHGFNLGFFDLLPNIVNSFPVLLSHLIEHKRRIPQVKFSSIEKMIFNDKALECTLKSLWIKTNLPNARK